MVDHLVAKVTAFREHVETLAQRDAADRRATAIGLGPQQLGGSLPAEQVRARAAAFAKAAATAAADPGVRVGPPSRMPQRGKATPSPRSRQRQRQRRIPAPTAVAERFASGEVAASSHIWRHHEVWKSPRADTAQGTVSPPGEHEDSSGSLLPPIGTPPAGADSASSLNPRLPRETLAALDDDPWAVERE